ncbi:hypothetical protein Tco_0005668, partial [Tanacetum coccineum]
MELYMMNRQHGRMILESVENGPLIWPTIEENGVTRPRKYYELSAVDAIQADCDVKATNIILQGLPPVVYALVSNHQIAKELWERIQLLMQGTSLTKQERECKLYDEFDKFAYKKGKHYGRQISFVAGNKKYQQTKEHVEANSWETKAQANGQILHEEELAFLADPGIAEVAIMANLAHYGSDALAAVHNPDNVDNNMINQGVQKWLCGEGSAIAVGLLKAISVVVNLLLEGRCPKILAEFMASAPLTPLLKPDNGIRPIAVGAIWRRLTSKVAMRGVRNEMSKYLGDFQFGVGVPSGAEAVLHGANRFLNKFHS